MPAAQFPAENLEDFLRDPLLAVACVLLIVVALAWIVVARLVSRNLRRANTGRASKEEGNIWSRPP